MVEFAIILPLMALVLVMAIDFGRVFFGWVGLQNATRIGASWASLYAPQDFTNPANPYRQDLLDQIEADAAGINCALPADADMLPQFPEGKDPGDPVIVSFECDFELLTPLLAPIFGGTSIPIYAESTFPIRAAAIDTPGGGVPPPSSSPTCRVVPDMDGMLVGDARLAWQAALFTGTFYPVSTAQDGEEVTAQFETPSANPGDCVDPTTTVTVSSAPLPPPPCPDDEARVPAMVGLTVSAARTTWFGAGFNTGTFTPATGSNGQMVQTQVVTPSTAAGDCAPEDAEVTVTTGTPPTPDCTVPDFIGSHSAGAQSTWTSHGFTTSVSFRASGQLPYRIFDQTLVAGRLVPCNSSIQLGPG